ncbi:MAG: O-antigen ligase family protein [Chromatiales bacterium]|nr:O-antigen ligase family protein [Chromatiales bacterium]
MGSLAVLVTIFGCLLVGHLAIATFFPSVAVNAVGVVLVALIIGYVLFVRNDVFATVLIILFCSHFNFANNQGGLFNLVAFLLLGIHLLVRPAIRETTRSTDGTVMSLLAILFVSNLLGLLLRNPLPLEVLGLQFAAFSGFLLAFHTVSALRLTEARLRQFLIVASVMAVYNFGVSLNQHYGVLHIETPLLGLTRDLFYATTNAFGTFGSASSNGQYAMMLLAVVLPLVAASASRTALKLSPIHFVPVAVAVGLTLILANMRAAALESVLIVVIYTIMFSLVHRRSFRNAKYVNLASAAVVIVLATVGVWFNLENIAEDFQRVQVEDVSSIETGKALNRLGPWQYGWERLQRESWWVGYGHGTDLSNQIAWGGRQTSSRGPVMGGGHLHNLYLALPMMFGWVGALAYVLLFVVVVFRLFAAVRRHGFGSIVGVTCLGFLMSLGFFLVDEVKSGNAVQTINYAMVAWIWLGLGLAAQRSLKAGASAARAQRQARTAASGAEAGESPAGSS